MPSGIVGAVPCLCKNQMAFHQVCAFAIRKQMVHGIWRHKHSALTHSMCFPNAKWRKFITHDARHTHTHRGVHTRGVHRTGDLNTKAYRMSAKEEILQEMESYNIILRNMVIFAQAAATAATFERWIFLFSVLFRSASCFFALSVYLTLTWVYVLCQTVLISLCETSFDVASSTPRAILPTVYILQRDGDYAIVYMKIYGKHWTVYLDIFHFIFMAIETSERTARNSTSLHLIYGEK